MRFTRLVLAYPKWNPLPRRGPHNEANLRWNADVRDSEHCYKDPALVRWMWAREQTDFHWRWNMKTKSVVGGVLVLFILGYYEFKRQMDIATVRVMGLSLKQMEAEHNSAMMCETSLTEEQFYRKFPLDYDYSPVYTGRYKQ